MADVNRGNRPLSPHLTVYRWQITMAMSILHRITGVGLALGAILGVWWFIAAATDAEYFASVDGFLTSWFGLLILFFSLVAFWYHFCNGIRHLVWDTGHAFEIDAVTKTGYAAIAGAAVLTIVTLIAA
ncbi:succinate dehydrogenase, cytochrome b556 subunit [soil metagenome]